MAFSLNRVQLIGNLGREQDSGGGGGNSSGSSQQSRSEDGHIDDEIPF